MSSKSDAIITESDIPPLVWPEFTDIFARINWWRACALAWSVEWNRLSPITPVLASEIDALEQRLGCTIPYYFAHIMNTLALLIWRKRFAVCNRHLTRQLNH